MTALLMFGGFALLLILGVPICLLYTSDAADEL